MRQLLDEFVPGSPKTKGSLDFKGGGRVVENVAGSKRWRMLMADRLRRAWNGSGGDPIARGSYPRETRTGVKIRVTATFYLPCARGARSLIAKGSGDIDKLARNLLDALTDSGIIGDDAQVVAILCEKREAAAERTAGRPGVMPQGVHVQVWEEP